MRIRGTRTGRLAGAAVLLVGIGGAAALPATGAQRAATTPAPVAVAAMTYYASYWGPTDPWIASAPIRLSDKASGRPIANAGVTIRTASCPDTAPCTSPTVETLETTTDVDGVTQDGPGLSNRTVRLSVSYAGDAAHAPVEYVQTQFGPPTHTVAHGPVYIALSGPTTTVTRSVGGVYGSAGGATDARWALLDANRTPWAMAVRSGGSAVATAVVPDTVPLGHYEWKPVDATVNGSPVLTDGQEPESSEVVMKSAAYLAVSRSGSQVSFYCSASRYSPYYHKWIRYTPSRQPVLQYWTGSAWTTFKYAYPTSSGPYRYTYTMSSARSYRLVIPWEPKILGSTSATVRG